MPVANEPVALDQLEILDEASGKQKPALDVFWIDKVDFIAFSPLPTSGDQASLEEWADRLAFIEEDLQRLLHLPYHKFWSQMVFDGSLHLCLDSYLRHAPRCFDVLTHIPEQYQDSLKHVHRLVFMTFLRLATHKESKEHFITPNIFGEILYENFLFDVPKLMDLCVLYGTGNAKLLTKMISNVFFQQPKYAGDLKAVIPTIFEVFDNISSKCGASLFEAKVSQNAHGNVLLMPVDDLMDILHYLADIAQSLLAFVDIYMPAAEVFYQAGFVNRLAALYEGVVPQLKRALKERQWENRELKSTIKKQLRFAESSIIDLCHCLINTTCIQQILENSNSKEIVQKKSEDFLDAIASVLAEKLFVADLDEKYSIEADLQLLQQSDQDNMLDGNRLRFILDGVRAAKSTTDKKSCRPNTNDMPEKEGAMAGEEEQTTIISGVGADDNIDEERADSVYQSEGYLQDYAGVVMPTDVEISSLISSVKDLLPDLGDGFIEACLEEFNFDASQVIDKILEEKLPATLEALDHKMVRSLKPKEESLLSQRCNIFDNDEFDVFNQKGALDKSRVHKGKKKEENVEKFLLDKSHVKEMKDVYTELGYTYDNEYDDEYDDTYDTINVGATDADSADELAGGRAFTTPRILQQMKRKTVKEEARDEEVELPEDPGPPRDEFVQNPAILREKREQKYQQRQQEKGKPKQDNLKGKPRGQGQDNNTVQARRRKEANKSQSSNHNRKAMASKKMAKGM